MVQIKLIWIKLMLLPEVLKTIVTHEELLHACPMNIPRSLNGLKSIDLKKGRFTWFLKFY